MHPFIYNSVLEETGRVVIKAILSVSFTTNNKKKKIVQKISISEIFFSCDNVLVIVNFRQINMNSYLQCPRNFERIKVQSLLAY